MRKYIFLLFCLPLVVVFTFGVPVSADAPVTIRVGIYEHAPKTYTDETGYAMIFCPEITWYTAGNNLFSFPGDDFRLTGAPERFSPVSLDFAFSKNAETPYLPDRCCFHIRDLKADKDSVLYTVAETWEDGKPEGNAIFPQWAKWLLIGIGSLVAVILIGAYLLRLHVRNRTRALREEIDERIRAEEKLAESERTLKLVSDNTQDIVCLHASDHKYIYISPSCKYILGYHPEELIGTDPWELVHPEDIEDMEVSGSEKVKKGEFVSLEYRIRCKSGEYKWFESVSSTLLNDAGSISGFVTSSRDISLRKQKEMEYATILAASTDGFWICDDEGRFLDVNKAYCRLVGYSRDELLEMKISDIDALESAGEIRARIARMRDTGGERFETRLIRKDGTAVDVEISASCINTTEERVIVFVRDVTERKQFVALLTESEAKYKSLVEHNDDAVLLTTPDGGIEAANPAACKIFGRTEQEMREAGRAGIIDSSDPGLIPLLEERQRTGKVTGLLTFMRKDGTSFPGEVTSVLFTDNEGKTKTSMVIRDITEQEKAEEELLLRARLLDNASDGICLFNQEGEYLYVNEMYCRTHDCTREELIGTNIRQMDSTVTNEWMDWLRNEMKQKGGVVFESTHFRRDGSEINLEVHSTEIEAGGNLYNLSVERDITERKQAEELLRESELFNSSLLENALNPIVVIHPDNSIRYVNPAMVQLTGYSFEELLGRKPPFPYWKEESIEYAAAKLKENMEHETKDDEVEFIRKNGDAFWVSITNNPVKTGDRLDYLLSTWVDITESKRATEALIESEEKYRSLVQSTLAGVYIEVDGKFVYVNPEFQKQTGYSETELLGMKADTIVHHDDRELVRTEAIAMLKGKRNVSYEFRIITAEGKIRWAMETVTSIMYLGIRASLGSIMDITERKRTEETLRLSDTTLRSINVAVIAIDNEDRVTFWNRESEGLFGIKASEAAGEVFFDLITVVEEYPGQREERLSKLKDIGYNREEQIYRTPNGDIWVDVHAQAIEDSKGRYGWVILASDITERKRMETALRESEEKFSEVFYANPKPMTIVTPDTGIINDVNQAFIRTSGFTKEECVGKTISELGLWASEDDRRNFVQKFSELESVQNFETKMGTKSGDIQDVILSTTTISLSDKLYIIISSDNITERKRMQENLIVTDRLASVGELAAGIAHELNNPLTGVIGFSDLLMERDDIPEDVMGDIAIINKEAVRASQVARHLLTFARKHPDEKKLVNVNSVIWLVMELRAYEQRVNNIEVISNLAEDLPNVQANEFQLQQVIINIIINAEHFMIEEHDQGRLVITTEPRGNAVRITITDDGPGVNSEQLNRIFDPFYTTKEVGKGTGLGLSICYGIIAEHGGRIWAESEPGKGATFIIELPVALGNNERSLLS